MKLSGQNTDHFKPLTVGTSDIQKAVVSFHEEKMSRDKFCREQNLVYFANNFSTLFQNTQNLFETYCENKPVEEITHQEWENNQEFRCTSLIDRAGIEQFEID